MMALIHPAFLLVGALLLLPYVLRPRQAWQYSWLSLLPSKARVGPATWMTTGLTALALTLLLIALANPQNTVVHTEETVQARDILLTLDLSLSMEGFLPDVTEQGESQRKLDLIRQAALTFVRQHHDDRLGLLVFGDEAFGVWPLSIDSATLQARLHHLDTLLPAKLRGTQVAKALLKSLDHMQERGQATTKMVLLLTDGLDRINPEVAEHILQRLREQQIWLYVLGLKLGRDASIVRLAHQAQGRYFDIDKAGDLANAFEEINRLEASRVTVTREGEPERLYRLFAFPGLILLIASMAGKALWVLDI